MRTKSVIIKMVTFRSGAVLFILGLLTILFCPWMWKSLPDGYFPYSGQVVDKGMEHHLFLTGENHWDNYIIVRNSDGTKKKKYLSDYPYAIVQTGTYVVKKKGFGEIPLRPGQKDPRELLRQFQGKENNGAGGR
jgi:hypothetical protein